MQKYLIVISLILFGSFTVWATGQAPDVLIYDHKIYDLFSNPLESYYKSEKEKPAFRVHPNIISVSSGNWRGYVATWEIVEDVLYLRGIDAWICDYSKKIMDDCKRADLKAIFGAKCENGKVQGDWFTGDLRIPDGKQLQYVHMGYGSVYERDILLTVKAGKIVGKTVVDNTKKQLPTNDELQKQELEKLKKSSDKKKTT